MNEIVLKSKRSIRVSCLQDGGATVCVCIENTRFRSGDEKWQRAGAPREGWKAQLLKAFPPGLLSEFRDSSSYPALNILWEKQTQGAWRHMENTFLCKCTVPVPIQLKAVPQFRFKCGSGLHTQNKNPTFQSLLSVEYTCWYFFETTTKQHSWITGHYTVQ